MGDGHEAGAVDHTHPGEARLQRREVGGVPAGVTRRSQAVNRANTAVKKAGRSSRQRWKKASGVAWTRGKSNSDPSRVS